MNAQDFADWRNRHPVTEAVFTALANLVQDGKEELAASAGENPVADARKSGKILGLQSILDMTFDEVDE